VPILKLRAWSLLRLLCGRFDPELPCERLHEGLTIKPGTVAEGAFTADGDGCAPVIDLLFLFWLFDAADETAASFRQIMLLLRECRIYSPDDLVGNGCAARGAECE